MNYFIKKEVNFDKIKIFLNKNFSLPTHWPDWNVIISKFYNTEFFYFVCCNENEILGICPVHKEKKGLLSYYYSGQFNFIPYGGWLFKKNMELDLKPLPISSFSFFQAFNLPLLSEFLFSTKNNIVHSFKTLVIDLQENLETIWTKSLDSKRRNMIRKAEKNNVKIYDGKNDLRHFYEVYKEASLKNNLKVLSYNFFEELFSSANNIKFEILIAKLEEKTLSIIVIVYDKFYSIYWLGNNVVNAPNLGQGELLQWEAIQRMKKNGCKYYDLCYIEKDRLPNIYEFKKGFSKMEVEVPLINHKPFIFRLVRKLQNVFRLL